MNKKSHKKMLMGGVFATLSLLPGCALLDMFKGKPAENMSENVSSPDMQSAMTGEVLVTLKGRPVITTDSLARQKEKIIGENPQIKQMLEFIPAQEFEHNILDGMIGQKIVNEYVVSHGMDETPEYKAMLNDLRDSANAKIFIEKMPVTVSETEIKSFYDAIKDQAPGVKTSQGGVAASGIEFADGAAARAFLAQAKASPGGFKKAAQDEGLNAKINDFKLVNSQSIGIDEMLRDKIVAIKTVPSVDMIEVKGKFWVINATAKEEPKYVPYEQLKDRLKQQVEQNKRGELLAKQIEVLKKEYAVEVNEDYFKSADTDEQDEQPEVGPARGSEVATALDTQEAVEKRLA